MSANIPKPEDSIGYALHLASFVFKTAMKSHFKAAGLDITPEEFVFLFSVPEGGDTQRNLTKAALKDKTTITRMVDRLVGKGWVERHENPESRREQIISTTSSGLQLKGQLLPTVFQLVSKATAGIDAGDLEITKKTLRHLTANLRD